MTREKLAAALGALPHDLLRSWVDMEELADSLAASEGADSYASQDTDGAARDLRDEVADALLTALDAPAQPVHPEPPLTDAAYAEQRWQARHAQLVHPEPLDVETLRAALHSVKCGGAKHRSNWTGECQAAPKLGFVYNALLREASEPEGAKE